MWGTAGPWWLETWPKYAPQPDCQLRPGSLQEDCPGSAFLPEPSMAPHLLQPLPRCAAGTQGCRSAVSDPPHASIHLFASADSAEEKKHTKSLWAPAVWPALLCSPLIPCKAEAEEVCPAP